VLQLTGRFHCALSEHLSHAVREPLDLAAIRHVKIVDSCDNFENIVANFHI
jgi:hypothetical protein